MEMHEEGFKNLVVALVDNAVDCAENPELSLGEEEFPTTRHKHNYLNDLLGWAKDPDNEIINVYYELEDKPHRKIEYRNVERSILARVGLVKSEMAKSSPNRDVVKDLKRQIEEQERQEVGEIYERD